MTRLSLRAAAAALLLAATAACAASSPTTTSGSPALQGSITVLAAASLTGSFTELGRQFEAAHPGTRVVLSFGASGTLAQQVQQGAPADVFASASTATMQQVVADVDAPRTFARNSAAVAVARDRAGTVGALSDLARPGVRVALCEPQVPCGALAQQVLEKAHLQVQPVTLGLDVKATLAYVASGEADAAIVYVTDVRAAGSSVVAVPVPADAQASTSYPIATVRAGRAPALARAFTDLVLSPAGQQVLAAAGFSPP